MYVILTFPGWYGRQEVVGRCFTVYVGLLLGRRTANIRTSSAHNSVPAECAEIPATRNGGKVLHVQHQLQRESNVLNRCGTRDEPEILATRDGGKVLHVQHQLQQESNVLSGCGTSDEPEISRLVCRSNYNWNQCSEGVTQKMNQK